MFFLIFTFIFKIYVYISACVPHVCKRPEEEVRSWVQELQGVVGHPVWVLRAALKCCCVISQPPFYLSLPTNYQSSWQASKSVLIIFSFLQVRDVIRRLLREVSSYPSTTYVLLFLVCVSSRLAYCPLHLSVLIMTLCPRVNGRALQVEGGWNSSDSSTSEDAFEHCWALDQWEWARSTDTQCEWAPSRGTEQKEHGGELCLPSLKTLSSSGTEELKDLPEQQNSRLFCLWSLGFLPVYSST